MIETYLVSWINDNGEIAEWFVDMTYEQAREVEKRLYQQPYSDIYVDRPGAPVSFDTFKADTGLFEED